MKETIAKLNNWLEQLSQFSLSDWEDLPDLYLYMDQVVTYLERELKNLRTSNEEIIITPWMINNYVKGKLIPTPENKKYSKEHLGYIIAICTIKQIMSINDIKQLFDFNRQITDNPQALYDFIKDNLRKVIYDVSKETETSLKPVLSNTVNSDEATKQLYDYATELALEASIKKIIANKIFDLIEKADEMKHREIEAKEKERLEFEKLEKEKTIKEQNKKMQMSKGQK